MITGDSNNNNSTGNEPGIGGGDEAQLSASSTCTSSNNNNNNNEVLWKQNEAVLESIEAETRRTQLLTSEKRPLIDYCNYSFGRIGANNNSNNNFDVAIQNLISNKQYTSYRAVRGDGNCYYRAFLYTLVEAIQKDLLQKQKQQQQQQSNNNNNNDRAQQLIQWIKNDSYQYLIKVGKYDETTIEIFYDCFIDLLDRIVESATAASSKNNNSSSDNTTDNNTTTTNNNNNIVIDLHTEMNIENSISDYCVWYLRILTATYIKNDPDRFIPFVIVGNSYGSVEEFCQYEIEPMGKECEQIQILALVECFVGYVIVQIEYIDGHITNDPSASSSLSSSSNTISFGPSEESAVVKNTTITPYHLTLLYRPGHYDILYKE